jgi:hypothetical protein
VRHPFLRDGVSLCLGRLESIDFAPISPQRKEAIKAFWEAYLAGSGPAPEIHLDGMEMLATDQLGCSKGNP